MAPGCVRVFADLNQLKQCKQKIEVVEESLNVVSETINLAGNTVRLKILFLLQEEGQLCPCDLSDILKMNVSAISQHLRKLKDRGIVGSKKTGQTIFYSINPDYAEVFKPLFKLIYKNKVLDMI